MCTSCCKEQCEKYTAYLQTFETAAVGKKAPCFKTTGYFPNGEMKAFDINDYNGKYVVLLFYPADFTFVCPTEMLGFNELAKEFAEINCQLVGVSCDSAFCHQAWCQAGRDIGGIGKLDFPLISDATRTISIKYNMLDHVEQRSKRGLVIIDSKGIVRYTQTNDDGIGRSTEETMRIVKAVQFTDENGVVCPLNWKPGKKAIVPTPKGISEFLTEMK
ncbi:putative peroxiredoxin [Entamoeba marina]